MYATIRQYKAEPEIVEEVVRRAREGFVPLIREAPGFVSYSIVDVGEEGVLTASFFEDKAGAEESVRIAASWVGDNLASLLPDPPQVTTGEISIREVKEEQIEGYHTVLRRYRFDPGDVPEVTRLVEEGLVPQIVSTPGFGIYWVLDAGDGVIVSGSAFADRASAEASNENTLSWVRENLARFLAHPPEVITGELKLRAIKAATAAGA